MCGRFTMTADDVASVAKALGVDVADLEAYQQRFNIAPTDPHFVVRMKAEDRQAIPARWGLIHYGSKDRRGAAKTINARAESVDSRPAFREAFKKRRCVVPARRLLRVDGIEGLAPAVLVPPTGRRAADVCRALRVVAARARSVGGDVQHRHLPRQRPRRAHPRPDAGDPARGTRRRVDLWWRARSGGA